MSCLPYFSLYKMSISLKSIFDAPAEEIQSVLVDQNMTAVDDRSDRLEVAKIYDKLGYLSPEDSMLISHPILKATYSKASTVEDLEVENDVVYSVLAQYIDLGLVLLDHKLKHWLDDLLEMRKKSLQPSTKKVSKKTPVTSKKTLPKYPALKY